MTRELRVILAKAKVEALLPCKRAYDDAVVELNNAKSSFYPGDRVKILDEKGDALYGFVETGEVLDNEGCRSYRCHVRMFDGTLREYSTHEVDHV